MAAEDAACAKFSIREWDGDVSALESVAALFEEYRQTLVSHEVPIDSFQGFSDEIAGLPGKYAKEKGGTILLAVQGDSVSPVGVVALRDLGDGTGEVKRLYVRPAARGHGVAAQLSSHLIQRATALGYRRLVLDTLHRLPHALGLYKRLGFQEIPQYCPNPMHDVVFLGLELVSQAKASE